MRCIAVLLLESDGEVFVVQPYRDTRTLNAFSMPGRIVKACERIVKAVLHTSNALQALLLRMSFPCRLLHFGGM